MRCGQFCSYNCRLGFRGITLRQRTKSFEPSGRCIGLGRFSGLRARRHFSLGGVEASLETSELGTKRIGFALVTHHSRVGFYQAGGEVKDPGVGQFEVEERLV